MPPLEAPLIGIDRHRLATDGDGITTLVAFHECPLRWDQIILLCF